MPDGTPTNDEIAGVLNRIADLLEAQEANPHRVRAYRNGANSIRTAERPVAEVVRQDAAEALEVLPGIGKGLAATVAEYVMTGRSAILDRLKGETAPEELFTRVPGIGATLARRIVGALDVHSLEELETAAHDGRLAQVEGFGPARIRTVRLGLDALLRRSGAWRRTPPAERPDVGLLLGLDETYRRKAEAGRLRTIAPRRFNPSGAAWLPILHTERKGWRFTVLYSNTARAHQLGTTRDWVVLYYERDGAEGQATVVTQQGGALDGRRVVRGRESECQRYYRQEGAARRGITAS